MDLAQPEATVDYAFHVCIKDVHGELLDSMEDAMKLGVTSFKVFMVYDFGVKDGVFFKILDRAKKLGALIAVHAENKELIDRLIEDCIAQGHTEAWYHYMSRPEFVEGEADNRAIAWARALQAPLYIVHLANKEAVELCAANPAKKFGCQQKGSLTVGKDADIVTYDPDKDFVITNDKMHSATDHTIWEAVELHGYPVQTYVRGQLVYNNGEFKGRRGLGQIVRCTAREGSPAIK